MIGDRRSERHHGPSFREPVGSARLVTRADSETRPPSRHPIADCQLPTADCRLPTPVCEDEPGFLRATPRSAMQHCVLRLRAAGLQKVSARDSKAIAPMSLRRAHVDCGLVPRGSLPAWADEWEVQLVSWAA